MKVFLLVLFMVGVEGEVIPGGGERTSGEYTIKHDRITIMPSGEARSRAYTALSGSRRFLESATPVIYFVVPSEVEKNKILEVGIAGDGFLSYPSPPSLFIGNRQIRDLKIFGSSSILWTYPGDMSEGIYDVKVVNNDGKYAIKKGGFRVKEPSMELYRVIPSSIFEGENGNFVLTGKNFKEGITVALGSYPTSVSKVSETSVEFSVSGLEKGIYDLYAFSPDGISASIKSAVQVVRRSRYTTVEREGCGCYEGSPSGIFSFIPLFIFFLIRRKRLLPLFLILLLSCGGKNVTPEVHENSPPVAEAGEMKEVKLYEWIRLDGKASTDPDGDELEFMWSMKKVPDDAVYYLFDAKTAEPLFMAESPGEYEVELIVSDGSLKSMPDYVTITVKGEGEVPVAHASLVAEGIGGVLQLSAENSFDPNGKPLIYKWEFINPPSCQSYRELPPIPNPLIPVECPKGTLYKFALTVSDGKFSSAPFEITAVIPDSPPVLSYLEDITLPSGANSFELSAGDIYDPDGDELTCKWKVEKKPANANVSPSVSNACTQRFSLTGSTDGYYVFLLQVSDGERVLNQWVNISIGKPSPPFISSLSVGQNVFPEGSSWIAEIDVECSMEKGLWGGSDSFVKYRFEVSDFPEDVSSTFLTPSEGYITNFSIPITASIEIRGKIRNMDEPVAKGRIACLIIGEEANYPFISEKWEPLIFTIPNSVPSVHIPDHSISLSDDVFQYAIIRARGYDADGDIISYRWSILYSPDGAFSFISQPYSDETAFFAGYGEEKKGVYLIRTVVMDEHGASSYDDFSVVIK
jgi:hypothetical protein